MVNFDQAEGLRRMLFGARPRFVTFLSALGSDEKNATLVNLSAGLSQQGHDVVLLDARSGGVSTASWLDQHIKTTLIDVAMQKRSLEQATVMTVQGFKLASLCRSQHNYHESSANILPTRPVLTKLNKVVEKLGSSVDLVLVDGELSELARLEVSALEEGEIVIQVTNQPDSIKNAYSLIKRAHAKLGRRDYGLLVTGVNESEAHRVYDAMAQAAGNFLSVPIQLFGFVPQDDYLRRATSSGRSVMDVYPGASAAMAFARLAQHMIAPNEFASTI